MRARLICILILLGLSLSLEEAPFTEGKILLLLLAFNLSLLGLLRRNLALPLALAQLALLLCFKAQFWAPLLLLNLPNARGKAPLSSQPLLRLMAPFLWGLLLLPLLLESLQAPFSPMFFLLWLSFVLGLLLRQGERCEAENKSLQKSYERQVFQLQDQVFASHHAQQAASKEAKLLERERIARQVHDHAGHAFSSALLQLGALRLEAHSQDIQAGLDRLHQTLDLGMSKLRQHMHDLHTEAFDLSHEVQRLLAGMPRFKAHCQLSLDPKAPLGLKEDLFSVISEALHNILKHSTGDRIEISLRSHKDFYTLRIYDNGNPEDWKEPRISAWKQSGLGLSNIEGYAHKHGGYLKLAKENGLVLRLRFNKGGTDDKAPHSSC